MFSFIAVLYSQVKRSMHELPFIIFLQLQHNILELATHNLDFTRSGLDALHLAAIIEGRNNLSCLDPGLGI